MTRTDFQHLVALNGKRIEGDVEFVQDACRPPLKRMRTLTVQATGEWMLKLDGWYNTKTDGLSFTFSCAQVGNKPVCRVDVRGPEHDEGGRTHKHELRRDSCPRKNLPTRIERPDLEPMTPQQVWEDLCQKADIFHVGTFNDPR